MPSVDARLTIEREVVGVLGHEHVREQARAGAATLDRHRRCRRPHDALASAAAELGADVAHDPKQGGHAGNDPVDGCSHLAQITSASARCRRQKTCGPNPLMLPA